ncbi:MAG: c-type cytochrome [Planctomycetes bacterium]|nr:c-type cytochrome [Planctomycetota bacterium]
MRRALLLLAPLVTACDREPPKPLSEMTPRELFLEVRCDSCHGSDRRGSWMGPPLVDLEQHWTAPDLARYLRDPLPVIEATPRLTELKRQYTNPMRAFPELPQAERLRLAEWLLVVTRRDQP